MALRQREAGSKFRTDPIRVVLGPRPGVTPCAKPPVRVFLGTEDAQHRAERVFFYSIDKHRDPARVYEVHLMKNLAGFRRQGWRTGFTNYRYAIPELAGGAGRAIYNDVDQIYLTDPAELFDREMGDHGYLAISPKDTSVMLIDCARMLPLWNRQTASSSGKAKLANEPAKTPGLWGRLDPGWNARDVEYIEGESKVLHYTALHQQPWHPFPEEYSYHPNPLAFLWHDLEREADAERYQLFTRSAPSPDFRARMADGVTDGGGATPIRPSERATEMMAAARARRVLALALDGLAPPAELAPVMADAETGRLDLAEPAAVWPEGEFDAVIATGVLDRAPSEDLPWLLDEIFARARGWVYLGAGAEAATFSAEDGGDAHCGRRTPEWWRTRVAEAAGRRPGVSWHLDVAEPGAEAPAASFQTRCVARAEPPRVWALLDGRGTGSEQVLRLAEALGWGFETKRLAFNALAACPNLLLGASLTGLDRGASSPLTPPWPDLVIGWGRRSAPVARWLRARSGGRTRLVQLGRPRAPFEAFDLIVTTPEEGLPVRPNVQHVAAPLVAPAPEELARARAAWEARLGDLPRPYLGLIVSAGSRPRALDERTAARLGRETSARAQGGSVLVAAEPGVSTGAVDTLARAINGPCRDLTAKADAIAAVLALADRFVVAGDDSRVLAAACATGKPVAVYELPAWLERLPALGRGLVPRALRATYRGTPFQQTALGRLKDRLVERGIVAGPRNLRGVREALVARGAAVIVGDERPRGRPRPLDDLEATVARVRRLVSEFSYAS